MVPKSPLRVPKLRFSLECLAELSGASCPARTSDGHGCQDRIPYFHFSPHRLLVLLVVVASSCACCKQVRKVQLMWVIKDFFSP